MNNEKDETALEVLISFNERTFQTFIITDTDEESLRTKITEDFENAVQSGAPVSDLRIEHITEIVFKPVEKPLPSDILNKGNLH